MRKVTMLTDHPFYLRAVSPVPGDYPSGVAADTERSYRLVQTELGKLGTLRQESINWELMRKESLLMLTERTKDIHCLTGLVMSLLSVGKHENIALAIVILEGFLQHWRKDGFPSQETAEGRKQWINRINQIVRRLRLLLETREFTREGNGGLEEAQSGLQQLAIEERWLNVTGLETVASMIHLVDMPLPSAQDKQGKPGGLLSPRFGFGFLGGIGLLLLVLLGYWFWSVKAQNTAESNAIGTSGPSSRQAANPLTVSKANCEDNIARVMAGQPLLFDSGSAVLTPTGEKLIEQLVFPLTKVCPETQIIIEGHSDTSGNDEQNLQVSQHRAEAVASLLAVHGLPYSRMETIGYGSRRPLMSNNTEEGRSRNRRIEIRLSLPRTSTSWFGL